MLRSLSLLVVVGAAAVVAGCGDDPPTGTAASAPPVTAAASTVQPSSPARPAAARGKRIAIVDSQFGRIVGDGRGQAFYVFDKERAGKSECYGACARAWPPVLTRGRPTAGKGVRDRLLGTVRRRSGKRQVTYRGRPLYYYVDDAPGRVLCHDVREFGGLWLVIRPDGTPVG
jgi:predicted lipoprotein with Yx(FWY)xxD motif